MFKAMPSELTAFAVKKVVKVTILLQKTAFWAKSHEASLKSSFVTHPGCGMGSRHLGASSHTISKRLESFESTSEALYSNFTTDFTKIMLKTAKNKKNYMKFGI